MKRSFVCAAVLAAAGATSGALADVTITLPASTTLTGFQFLQAYAPGTLTGTLTSVSINVTLEASVNYTYADDLTIYLDTLPLGTGGSLQVGGFSNLAALERHAWPNGASDAPGTTSIGTVILTTPIDMAITTDTVWIGNGYGASGTSGTWSGSLTLHGVTEIPAPGSAALLGLGGLVALRRRRA